MTDPWSRWLFPASPHYVVALLSLVALYWLIVPRRARGGLLLLISAAHAAALAGWGVVLLLALITFVQRRCRRLADGAPVRLGGTLLVLLGAFSLLKLPLLAGAVAAGAVPVFVPIAGADPGVFLLPLGTSYCLFRLVHVAVESHKGRVGPSTWTELTLYVLFFPTLRAGPIERLNNFTASASLTAREIGRAHV